MYKFGTPFVAFLRKKLEGAKMISLGQITSSIMEGWSQEFWEAFDARERSLRKRTREKRAAFIPPTPAEVEEYGNSINYPLDGEEFVAHYAKKGWKVNGQGIVCWKAAVVTWKKGGFGHLRKGVIRPISAGQPAEPKGWREWGIETYPQAVYWEDGMSWATLPDHVRTKVLAEMPRP